LEYALLLDAAKESLKRLPSGKHVCSILEKSVFTPVQDILSRPCKEVRARLTHLGFLLAHEEENEPTLEQQKALTACGELIELLHAGSLVVDDIQDNSEVRRGGPALHLRYGLPLALNVGIWMYFYAFEPLKQLHLPSEQMLAVYQATQETLLSAHYGQALDLSTRIDELNPEQISEVSYASLELKTGALMALAIELGAIIGGASADRRKTLNEFGLKLGISLQMFDDIGNLKPEKPTAKHLEDLTNRRPSFVWAFLAQKENQTLLPEFKEAIRHLPDITKLKYFIHSNNLTQKMWDQSWQNFLQIQNELKTAIGHAEKFPNSFNHVYKLGERIAHAY